MKQYRVLERFVEHSEEWEFEEEFKSLGAANDYINYELSYHTDMDYKIQSREIGDWTDETV